MLAAGGGGNLADLLPTGAVPAWKEPRQPNQLRQFLSDCRQSSGATQPRQALFSVLKMSSTFLRLKTEATRRLPSGCRKSDHGSQTRPQPAHFESRALRRQAIWRYCVFKFACSAAARPCRYANNG